MLFTPPVLITRHFLLSWVKDLVSIMTVVQFTLFRLKYVLGVVVEIAKIDLDFYDMRVWHLLIYKNFIESHN